MLRLNSARAMLAAVPLLPMFFGSSHAVALRSSSRQAQKDPLSLEVDVHYRSASLATIVNDLSKKYMFPVMADGAPAKKEANIDCKGSLRLVLEQVGKAFDYSFKVTSSGAVVMTKKFEIQENHPQYHALELRQSAQDILSVLPALPYDPKPQAWARKLRQFAQGLTPDQLGALRAGNELQLKDMSADQREAFQTIVALRAFGETRSMWERLYRQLDRLDAGRIKLVKQGVFVSAEGKNTAFYNAIFESSDRAGNVEEALLGQFRREVKQ